MELIDVRTKLRARDHVVLAAVARATGKDMAEIMREIIHEWADAEVHKATLVLRMSRSEGTCGSSQGIDP